MRTSDVGPLVVTAAVTCSLLAMFCSCKDPSTPSSAAPKKPPHAAAEEPHRHADPHVEHDHSQHVLSAAAPLTTDSIYHSSVKLTDQDGRPFELASLRGSMVLASMFYSSCTSVCPVLIAELQRIVDALPKETRAQTHVLLVSLDPKRDSIEKLKQLSERHKIDDPQWHFVRTDSNGVREVSALLGIRYRELPDGEISHSQVIALLDSNGVIVKRTENAAADRAQLLTAMAEATKASSLQAAQ